MKQDRQGARTVQDLERKYQFNRKFSEVMGVASDAKSSADSAKARLKRYVMSYEMEEAIAPLKEDYIVEQGTKDGWTYRKWNSGLAECWKILTHKTAITTSWGALYQGTATSRQEYPFPFIDKPVEQASLTAGSHQAILFPEKDGNGVNGAYASACYNVCRPSSVATVMEFYINFHVSGRWR
jgi:hypothetical protein